MLLPLLPCLLFLLCAAEVFSETCPPPEYIRPCGCTALQQGLLIVCSNPNTTLPELEHAFVHLQGKRVTWMILHNLRFERLPSILFWDLHIQMLTIQFCDIKYISDGYNKPSFCGLEDSLEYLGLNFDLHGNNSLTSMNLSHLRRLQSLDIFHYNIPKLGRDWFQKGPFSLRNIRLYRNNMRVLDDRAFETLLNLQNLQIYFNNIQNFPRTMLPNPSQIVYLVLGSAGLTTLPEDFFSGMPSLAYVDLSQNGIEKLPSNTWRSIWEQLTVLVLNNNPLNCDADIEWTFDVNTPRYLQGKCTAPTERENRELKEVIDENKNKTS